MGFSEEQFRLTEVIHNKGSNIDYLYPCFVSKKISDSELVMASPIRKKGRFPILSYYNKKNGCCIWRSSELTAKAITNRSIDDEKILAAMS